MVKRIVVLVFSLCIIFSSFIPISAQGEVPPEGFEMLSENSNFALYLRKSDFNVALLLKNSSGIFYSSPKNWNEDDAVDVSQRVTLGSFLIVNSVDERGTKYTANSAVASVNRGGAKSESIKNGVKITFDFPRKSEEFTIPVALTLENDGLKISILYDKIKEYGTLKINEISLMPGFGCGEYGSDGYLLIPDGSGFISEFTKAGKDSNAYRKSIYGKDPVLTTLQQTGVEQSIRMPVFGIKRQENAFLAVMEAGGALGFINAFPPTGAKTFGAVYSSFVYRQIDTTTLADKNSNYRELNVISKKRAAVNPTVKYRFLQGKNATYSGMANTYRDYLLKDCGLKRLKPETDIPFIAELFGGVQTKDTFLGFAYNRLEKATTFAETQKIIDMLHDSGIKNQKLSLIGFSSGGLYGDYQKTLSFDRSLGGNSGYQKLLKNNEDVDFFPYFEPSVSYDSSFSLSKNAAKKVNKDYAYRTDFKRSTGVKNEQLERGFFISLPRMETLFGTYLKKDKFTANNHAIAVGDLGDRLHSDFNPKANLLRDESQKNAEKLLLSAKTKYDTVMLMGGNAYAAPAADYFTETPVISSGYSLESRTVPFYQMVFHGLVNLSGTPFNISGDVSEATLLAIEGGLSPIYRLSGRDTKALSNTRMNFLYNSFYENWREEIKTSYQKINSLTGDLQDVFILSHTTENGVSICRYENGVIIYTNYSDEDKTVGDILIPALDAVRQ